MELIPKVSPESTVMETSLPPDPEEPDEIETRPLSPNVAIPVLNDRLPLTSTTPASERVLLRRERRGRETVLQAKAMLFDG